MGRGSGKTPRGFEGDTGGMDEGPSGPEPLLENDLSERDQNTSTVLRALEEHVVYQDLQNRIVWTNKAAGDSVSSTPQELLGQRCHEVWHGREDPCEGCPIVRARETGDPQQAEMATPDGRHWSIRGFPILDDDGQVVGVVEITSEITGRKKTEEAYRRLAERSLQGLGIFQDRKLVLVNEPLAEMIGRSVDDLYAMTYEDILDVMHRDDRERLRQNVRDRFKGRPVPEKQTYRIVRPDGEVRTLETLSDMTEYEGAPALQVAYWDVTDRKKAEDAYRTLVETSLQGISIVQDGRTVYSNQAAVEIGGYTAEELAAATADEIMEMVHEDDRERVIQGISALLAGEPVEARQTHRIVRKDGEVRWVDTMSALIEYGGRPAIQVAMEDVTDAKLSEERLRRERDRAQMYLDVAGVMMLVLDDQANVTLINRAGCRILGGEEKDIVGKNWIRTFIPERLRPEIRDVFDGVVRGEVDQASNHENPVLTLEGEERTVAWTNSIIWDESGRIVATLSSGEDVTEKRQAEEERLRLHAQLQQSQKLEAIGTLAGGVAHEINNPVNITMNFARLIKDRSEPGTQIEEFAQEIIDEGERMSSIVRKLLSFARQEKERHSAARIVDIVDSTMALINMVMLKDQIAIEIDIHEDLPKVLCRSQQIQQVLMNLLTNARDALNDRFPTADPDKVIRITARRLERDGQPWVRTTVEDHGTGIRPGALGKVFDPFFTTKSREQGTGLGLSVSYGIVKEHRGDLWVESEPGVHTRFHMDLRVDNGWRLEAGGEEG